MEAAGQTKPIYSEKDLPSGTFQIIKLGMSNASDADLANIARLRRLSELNLSDANLSDAGIEQLTGSAALARIVLNRTSITSAGVAALQKALPSCKIEWIAAAKPIATHDDPAFQQWMKNVASLFAEPQAKAVAKKLQELNPGFDGNEKHKIEKGVVTELQFNTMNVTDISPVRALAGLRVLTCGGSARTLSDLSPLKGMHLTALVCNASAVTDLSPLKGMPLTDLGIWDTPVSDLSPLNGTKLTHLLCYRTRVADLSPLKGVPLETLNCCDTKVADLSPLEGMHLTEFFCLGTGVSDLSPLTGMRLTLLSCANTKVSDLSPLKGMPLTWLACSNTPVTDLSPLEGMNLANLVFTPSNITKGLDVVRQMKSLTKIGIFRNNTLPAADFWKKYDAGEFGKPDSTSATPDQKPNVTLDDPAFQQWMKTVATMPAEKQVQAVAKKLEELNPGFDGKESHNVAGGVVTELKFNTDKVTDDFRRYGRGGALRRWVVAAVWGKAAERTAGCPTSRR